MALHPGCNLPWLHYAQMKPCIYLKANGFDKNLFSGRVGMIQADYIVTREGVNFSELQSIFTTWSVKISRMRD